MVRRAWHRAVLGAGFPDAHHGERGARTDVRGLFGHTARHHALARDGAYAQVPFAAVWERVAAAFIDVQVDGRLVRVHQHQGEYLPLQLMLAGLKTLASRLYNPCVPADPKQPNIVRLSGFDASYPMRNIDAFPHAVWREERRKRTHFNAVLARQGGQRLPARLAPAAADDERPLPAQPGAAPAHIGGGRAGSLAAHRCAAQHAGAGADAGPARAACA